jgi:hypothetical protein
MMKAAARRLFGMAVVIAAVSAAASAAEFPIVNTTEDDDVQGIAFDGTNFLVSFQKRSPGALVGAKLVSPAGAVLATVTAPIGDPPDLAFGATNYLLAWAEFSNYPNSTARGLLVNLSGAAVGSPFLVSQSNKLDGVDGVAFDGTNYLVVWTDQRRVVDPPQPGDRDVYGRFISAAGVPVGNEFKISGAAGKRASVAFAAPNYLVAWNEDVADQQVYAAFVTPAGVVGTEFTVNGSAASSENPLRVATDGTNFLVAFPDFVGGANDWDLFAQRVSPAGALLGGVIPLATAPGAQFFPFIAFDGANYLVTWTDLSGDTNADFVCDTGEGLCVDLHGQFVRADGTLVGENTWLTPDAGFQAKGPIAFGAGKYLLAWVDRPPAAASGDVTGTFIPVDFISKDAFESGTAGAWSAVAMDGGDLGINASAPLEGLYDLKGVVNDTNSLYVEDHTPLNEDHYRARFRLNPSAFDPGEAQNHFRTRVLVGFEEAPTRRLLAVVLKRQGGQYSLMARSREDSNAQVSTAFHDVSGAPHTVEVEWKRATSPSSGDGELRLWIDGTLQQTLTGLQNNRSSVDFARLGALSVKDAASGTLWWDDFESRRASYIGP